MNLEQFKMTVGPRQRELIATTVCLAQIHASLNNDQAFTMMQHLVEACLAKEWGIDPGVIAAAGAFIEAQLGHQDWTLRIDKNGDLMQTDILFKPRTKYEN